MRPMKGQKGELDRQMEAAYRDNNAFGRMLASVLLAFALVALFIYRAATTDPLWESELPSNGQISSTN